MKNLLPLLALTALMSGAILTGCAKEAEPVATPETSQSTDTDKTENPETVEPPTEETSAPESNEPLADKPADGEEVAVLETGKGKIVVMFYPQLSPKHVENYKMLVKKGFYDGTRFHRCIEGFMIQGGDPLTKDLSLAPRWGTGGNTDESGKEVNVPAEFNSKLSHTRGVLSAARSQSPDSASSQFFLMHQDSTFLDNQYSSFGRIVMGQEVVDEIVKTGDAANNGAVKPEDAVLLKKAYLAKWPVK